MPKGGPGPLSTGAFVQVVGCLTQGSGDAWVLTNSSEPAATTLDTPTRAERMQLEAILPGPQMVRLLGLVPSPDEHKGKKVEAKGLLIRSGNDVAVNVLTLSVVASGCR